MAYYDLQKGRHSVRQQAYVITTVTLNRSPVFTDFRAARLLIRELRTVHDSGEAVSLAWVVMPDHLHWLLQLEGKWSLSDIVKALKARSARSVNALQGRTGSLWQRAYHDRAIRRAQDLRVVARYLVANPLRAGLVGDVCDYPHWDSVWMSGGLQSCLAE